MLKSCGNIRFSDGNSWNIWNWIFQAYAHTLGRAPHLNSSKITQKWRKILVKKTFLIIKKWTWWKLHLFNHQSKWIMPKNKSPSKHLNKWRRHIHKRGEAESHKEEGKGVWGGCTQCVQLEHDPLDPFDPFWKVQSYFYSFTSPATHGNPKLFVSSPYWHRKNKAAYM